MTNDESRDIIAAETGVPAALITGDNEAVMREHAAAVADYLGVTATPPPPRMKPDRSQGGTGRPVPFSAREIARAEYERRHGPRDEA